MGSGGEAHESAGTGGARRERCACAAGGQGAEARRVVHMWGWERGRSASACRGQTCRGADCADRSLTSSSSVCAYFSETDG